MLAAKSTCTRRRRVLVPFFSVAITLSVATQRSCFFSRRLTLKRFSSAFGSEAEKKSMRIGTMCLVCT